MSYTVVRKSIALTILAAGLLAAVPVAQAEDPVCEGYNRKQKISRLGGRAAFSGTPVTSPAELKAQLDEHRAEIEPLMAEKGLGHLTDALYAAVDSGQGLSERDLARGEVFEWMTYRKRSGPVAFGPMCVATKKTYDAYVIEVTEEEAHPAMAKCALSATGGACVENEIMVDAGGSSPGVEVEMMGPGGSKTIISGGSTSWKGLPEGAGNYSFKATAQAKGTKSVTTHTFVIPKICLNLAYAGKTSDEREGETDSCQQTASVMVNECKPSCEIQVNPTQVRRKESVTVEVTGKWDDGGISVEVTDPKSNSFATLTDFPATVTPKKCGTYTLAGTATNSAGTATCGGQFTVCEADDSRWTARFFGAKLYVDDGEISQSLVRPNGVSERSHLSLDNADGFGAGLEYHFNPKIGLEATVISASLEAELQLDLDEAWDMAEDDASLLAFLIGPNFHLTPDKKVDVYIGPFIGVVDLGNVSYQLLGETQSRSLDADTAFGAQLGVDIPFGQGKWAVHTGVRYMDLSVEIMEDGPEIAADPFVVELGFAYRF